MSTVKRITNKGKIAEMMRGMERHPGLIVSGKSAIGTGIYNGYKVQLFIEGDEVTAIEVLDKVMPDKVEATARICKNGTSLTVSVTKEVKMLGLGVGDLVKVTLERP